ncbi:gp53-like domain-containing protein [Agrobacterium radiobacter]|uniref:gp53-like domain-containing protein n=1 Tax=Agrobacterium radiobacter TaxID=362 RepID=UPI003F839D90
MTALYEDGTVTLVQGSPVIVGNDTGWKVALIVGGTVFVEAEGGSPLPILPDDSDGANLHPITNTQMTAAINWTGPSGTYNYALVRDMSYSRQQSANADALALYLQRLNNPSLAAVSGLVPEADSLILFTGPDTATVIQRSSLVQGVDYDADADNIAGRNLYSSEAKGFSVLVANAGDGRTAIFIKRSSTDGDWSVPFYLSGPIGPKGDTGETGIVDKGAYVATDLYAARDAVLDNGSTWLARIAVPPGNPPPVLPATQNDYWRLLARRGIDGTGIGDVIGPNGGVVDGRPVAWDGTSGKYIKPVAGTIAALHALAMSANAFPYFSSGTVAALADLTPFARTLLDDADGAAMWATLGFTSWGSGNNRGVKLPDGTIFQWGLVTATGGAVSASFPMAFPSAVYAVIGNNSSPPPDGTTVYTGWADSWTLSTFAARGRFVSSAGGAPGAGGVQLAWFAIGR